MMISLHLVVGLAERGVACIFRIQKLLLENAKVIKSIIIVGIVQL